VAGLFKKALREMPETLLTDRLYPQFCSLLSVAAEKFHDEQKTSSNSNSTKNQSQSLQDGKTSSTRLNNMDERMLTSSFVSDGLAKLV
jgi:hypothetical protein